MVVAIGGPSNAGKSQLARLIADHFSDRKVVVLCQDDFVYPEKELAIINGHTDWDHPDTIDFELFEATIRKASKEYDLVIAEGFLIYYKHSVAELFDRTIFIEITKETFLQRKRKDLRWGREPEWYISYIWDQYLAYGLPPAGLDPLRLNGEEKWPMTQIVNYLTA